ncbi:hypothetical protein [Microbulbifer epialgicus]
MKKIDIVALKALMAIDGSSVSTPDDVLLINVTNKEKPSAKNNCEHVC